MAAGRVMDGSWFRRGAGRSRCVCACVCLGKKQHHRPCRQLECRYHTGSMASDSYLVKASLNVSDDWNCWTWAAEDSCLVVSLTLLSLRDLRNCSFEVAFW